MPAVNRHRKARSFPETVVRRTRTSGPEWSDPLCPITDILFTTTLARSWGGYPATLGLILQVGAVLPSSGLRCRRGIAIRIV
jgi:hypothetical protein